MAETIGKPIKTFAEMVGNYPAKDLPIIYADNVPSAAWYGGVAKFYLIRNDPSILADSTTGAQLVAQVVMPITGFATTAVFFEEQLKMMIDGGHLKAEAVEEIRASYHKRREEKNAPQG